MSPAVRSLRYVLLLIVLSLVLSEALMCFRQVKKLPTIEAHGGEITKVAVVDTGLDLSDPRFKDVLCPTGHKDFTGFGIKDNYEHGTHIVGLIKEHAGNAPYCLIILKYYSQIASGRVNFEREIAAFKWAVEQGATIINFSGGGPDRVEEEEQLIRSHPEVRFIVAAGNDHYPVNDPGYYPAAIKLPNITVVGSMSVNGSVSKFSNYGPRVDVYEFGEDVKSTLPRGRTGTMRGTSQATAIHTGRILSALIRAPR